jgi:hypothetical protein
MIITVYVIRHKPSGGYLPMPRGRLGRGGSHTEPVIPDGSIEKHPRLFPNEKNAKNCLAAWLHGKYVASRGGGGLDNEYWEEIGIDHQAHRVREDMEIVPIAIGLP